MARNSSSNTPLLLTRRLRFCKSCLEQDPKRAITVKAPARKSHRKRAQRDYANLNAGFESDPNRWLRMLEGKTIKENNFAHMKGADVSLQWLEEDESALTEPIIIESPEGLGMKMPSSDFTVDDVAEHVGEETPVEVIGNCLSCPLVEFNISTTVTQMWLPNLQLLDGQWVDG